ncbi:MAG: type II secretion system GspH family protein [Candidatus Nomurabacteria bacterium]|jgi:type II secretory pathway pseudopilin PulG|nr:type II secretion system GspH family protein [Candidatus Nomurabacteria bacterium]
MKRKRGDTVIEVIFATTIFGLIAVISISLMNSGISTAQAAVELTLARNEIDAQAEALRFIQNGFAAERENDATTWQFDDLWDNLTDNDGDSTSRVHNTTTNPLPEFHVPQQATSTSSNYQNDGCATAMNSGNMQGAFILNTRRLTLSTPVADPNTITDLRGRSSTVLSQSITDYNELAGTIVSTPLYPRIIYSTSSARNNSNEENLQEDSSAGDYVFVRRSEGLWVLVTASNKTTYSNVMKAYLPDYYDFHIRACWYAPASAIPSTIGTIVRLYNPRVTE